MEDLGRVIGRYESEIEGPLLICLGGIHGNEPAGVRAIQIVTTLLENEADVNPDFSFRGRLVGIIGNKSALRANQRYIAEDLNRILTPERLEQIHSRKARHQEESEIKELVTAINKEIEEYRPQKIVLLDIHSTSATGGIFVITSGDPESARIGATLHAPVILDFVHEVKGTTLGFFTKENLNTDIVSVVFECGQHTDPLSVNRAIAAIINCMRTIGCIRAEDVENKHDLLLQEYAAGLPKVARLIEHYTIDAQRTFRLVKEYQNFEQVSAGQVIAYSGNIPVTARQSGLILLPRLQDRGTDGFFIVRPEEY